MTNKIPIEVLTLAIGCISGLARGLFEYAKADGAVKFDVTRYLASAFVAGFLGVVTGWLGTYMGIHQNLLFFLISVVSFSGGGIMELYLKVAKEKLGI